MRDFDFKSFILFQWFYYLHVWIFILGFLIGSIVTFQLTKKAIEDNYECFPIQLKVKNDK